MAMPRSFAISIAIAIAVVGFLSGRFTQLDSEGLSNDSRPAVNGAPNKRQIGIKKWSGPGDGPPDLVAELEREANPLARYKLALEHMESWVKRDPRGALDWIKSQQASARRKEVMRLAIGQFAESDPKGAAEWVLANLSGVDLHNTLIQISAPWSRINGTEAATWLSSLPTSKERDAALESALFGWGTVDPVAAVEYAGAKVTDKGLASVLRRASYAGWAKSDPVAAVSASLDSSRGHGDMTQFANTLANWATVDLAASSEWLSKNVSNPAERAEAVLELSTIFARQSPDAGLEWIGGLPDENERRLASNQFAVDWASVDSAASAKWASEQSPGLLSDQAQMEILQSYLADDATAFDQWRKSLPEGALKQKAADLVAPANEEGE
jgi:hypothetical protein